MSQSRSITIKWRKGKRCAWMRSGLLQRQNHLGSHGLEEVVLSFNGQSKEKRINQTNSQVILHDQQDYISMRMER